MFTKSIIALATVASFAAAAPVEQRGAPKGWAYGYLEDYDTYHIRYLALKCQDQHNTQFFQDCCRPMLATENLADNRKAYCVPSQDATASVASSLSAQAAGGPTSTASADGESESEYCESESSASEAGVTQAPQTPASTATPAASTTSKVGEEKWAPAPSSSSTTTKYTPAPTTQAPTTQAPTTQAPTTQAPAATQAPSSGGGEQMTGGYATFFYQGGQAGACGSVHGDYDMIVAIDQDRWGSSNFGNGSPTCGRWLTITNTNNGKTVSAMVADVCPTCTNGNSLDLSVGAFNAIANPSDGMVPISWSWN